MKIFRLPRLLVFSAVTIAISLLTPWARAATRDEQDVLAAVNAMFDGMALRDPLAIKTPALPGAMLVLRRDEKTEQITIEGFAERVGKGKTRIDERIHDPLMRIDNDLAMVWAPFDFLVDGKLDHCGTDLFSLVYTEGKWLIASLTATVRRDCRAK